MRNDGMNGEFLRQRFQGEGSSSEGSVQQSGGEFPIRKRVSGAR